MIFFHLHGHICESCCFIQLSSSKYFFFSPNAKPSALFAVLLLCLGFSHFSFLSLRNQYCLVHFFLLVNNIPYGNIWLNTDLKLTMGEKNIYKVEMWPKVKNAYEECKKYIA